MIFKLMDGFVVILWILAIVLLISIIAVVIIFMVILYSILLIGSYTWELLKKLFGKKSKNT